MIGMKNLYEVNTAVWLSRLSASTGHLVTLDTVPEEELDRIASYGMDAVWLMGVWQRSPVGAEMSRNNKSLLEEIRAVLPDATKEDIIGSAYSIQAYRVDEQFGGNAALAQLRARLATRNMKLILDYIPNHTGFDHEWVALFTEYYIRDDGGQLVCAKDPTYEPWPDVAQLNAFSPTLRTQSISTLVEIAALCDGVRCDMAMLFLNDIFSNTWGDTAGRVPDKEYWQLVIDAVRTKVPDFIFIAETYWQTERRLIQLGFDYCYDKTYYDYVVANPGQLINYLANTSDISEHLVRFLENHDEPRIASLLTAPQISRAIFDFIQLPGLHLWHDGQWEGCQKKLPVHIRRGPVEAQNLEIIAIYRSALTR